jgi:proline racemase
MQKPLRRIGVIGCHAEGEIGDVIVEGVEPPPGASVYEQMRAFERDHDDVRRFLIQEPRGSVARHVNLIVPSTRADCAYGVIVMEPTEYPPMSGSNTMCAATVLLETGMVEMSEPVTRFNLELPGGPVGIEAQCRDGKCVSVAIRNVPCFALSLDAPLEVEGVGAIRVDISYGGMIYAIADAEALGFAVEPSEARDLAVLGEKIRIAAREQIVAVHPENPGISGVSIVQFARPFKGSGIPVRNTCIVAPGRSDRSPTGTGTCARMAALAARGLMRPGDSLIHESIIGTRFTGTILEATSIAGRDAILPRIEGRAWITGESVYTLDADDPFPSGYAVADTWGTTFTLRQES